MRPTVLAAEAVSFRGRIIDGLEQGGRRIGYIDADTIDAACPLCGGILSVYFAGTAPRADLICRRGCDEREVGDALARLTERRAA